MHLSRAYLGPCYVSSFRSLIIFVKFLYENLTSCLFLDIYILVGEVLLLIHFYIFLCYYIEKILIFVYLFLHPNRCWTQLQFVKNLLEFFDIHSAYVQVTLLIFPPIFIFLCFIALVRIFRFMLSNNWREKCSALFQEIGEKSLALLL